MLSNTGRFHGVRAWDANTARPTALATASPETARLIPAQPGARRSRPASSSGAASMAA